MITIFANKLATILYQNDEEKSVDLEVYKYGLELILSSLANLLVLIILSGFLGCINEMLTYILFFSTLRILAGGYHCRTHYGCTTFYSILALGMIYVSKITANNSFNSIFALIACALSVVFVYRYAPLDTNNKPLNRNQKIKFKKISRQVVLIEIAVILVFSILLNSNMIVASGGMLIESITLLPVLNRKEGI